jgi:hypothetical protein
VSRAVICNLQSLSGSRLILTICNRLRARHPIEEWDDVVCNLGHTGRVLGNCQITRAFGDADNKRQINDIAK